jgi:hypothetical protein
VYLSASLQQEASILRSLWQRQSSMQVKDVVARHSQKRGSFIMGAVMTYL